MQEPSASGSQYPYRVSFVNQDSGSMNLSTNGYQHSCSPVAYVSPLSLHPVSHHPPPQSRMILISDAVMKLIPNLSTYPTVLYTHLYTSIPTYLSSFTHDIPLLAQPLPSMDKCHHSWSRHFQQLPTPDIFGPEPPSGLFQVISCHCVGMTNTIRAHEQKQKRRKKKKEI